MQVDVVMLDLEAMIFGFGIQFCIKNDGLLFKMMDFELTMMDFVFKMMDFAFKMMNFGRPRVL